MSPLVFALPWLGILAFVVIVVRLPRPLPTQTSGPEARPRVSIVVPARNEAVNIVTCLRSLSASTWDDLEIIVVDDRSDDGTGALARSVSFGGAHRLTVLDGAPLPDGWLGKPWACRQGAEVATGALILFTDADTTHGSDLLAKAVTAMEEDGADLFTLVGRQLMESFWERLVQPQIFLMMLLRFPRFERTAANDRWRDAIANGQFMLFRREAYERIGGHEAVRDEVVEDLALAQHVKRAGLALRIRSADDDLATRMYRSLGQLVEGWSKNIVMGGLQSFPRPVRPLIAPVSFFGGLVLWLLAPGVLVLGLMGLVGTVWVTWAGAVYGLSVATWAWWVWRMDVSVGYALMYPLGAAVVSGIFLRSWVRGRNVRWKGRDYTIPAAAERP